MELLKHFHLHDKPQASNSKNPNPKFKAPRLVVSGAKLIKFQVFSLDFKFGTWDLFAYFCLTSVNYYIFAQYFWHHSINEEIYKRFTST